MIKFIDANGNQIIQRTELFVYRNMGSFTYFYNKLMQSHNKRLEILRTYKNILYDYLNENNLGLNILNRLALYFL